VIVLDATWPGAPAASVVADPVPILEHALGEIGHVRAERTVARAGRAQIRVELEPAADLEKVLQSTRQRLGNALDSLPRDMPRPRLGAYGPLAGRYLVRDLTLPRSRVAVQPIKALEQVTGVARVVACGTSEPRIWVEADAERLAAAGVTISDIVSALQLEHDDGLPELGATTVMKRQGVPVRVLDVANVHDGGAPFGCTAIDAHGEAVVLDVYAMPGADPASVRDAIARAVPGVQALAIDRTIVVGLAGDVAEDPERRVAHQLRDVIANVPGLATFVVEEDADEDGAGTARVYLATTADGAADLAVQRIRALATVTGAGEPTHRVVLAAADPATLARDARMATRALSEQGQLIATRGVVTHEVTVRTVDHQLAVRLDVSATDAAQTARAHDGIAAIRVTRGATEIPVVVRANGEGLLVRGEHALVPLEQLVRSELVREPLELVRDTGMPAVVLEVSGDEAELRSELAVAGLSTTARVTIEPR
jgi:multidrug efflux pump subunit AcrB